MTTLGQAYVQIMPSAKGISGSIQKTLDPEATSAGKSAGSRIASSISDSMGSLGKTLTKSITLPALGAAAAVGGIVAAFGWKRLTGLDSARAQLQGLGYDAESVDRISKLVSDSIQGTVTTMAEGVAVAAGALAAGVDEGADLERYIKLVGDAAVGAGRSTDDMGQIFNRVQGSGKLMTMELNMIEQGMPGFAMAMSKSLGVPQEEFRKMVTDGKVSSGQFLDVMEGFAGKMSDAYAGSWQGIVSRTKSNIGILGETMLGGVFEKSKESLADFLDFIRSEDVRGWFADAGQAIGAMFNNVIETIKNAIQWWVNLDENTKSLVMTISGIAIAIGPVLLIASKLIGVVMTLSSWFGLIKVAAGVVGTAIGAISAPVLVVVGVITGLIALFVALYTQNEAFRDLVQVVWSTIQETIMTVVQAVSDFVMEVFGGLVEWWNENNALIMESIQVVWNLIQSIIMAALSIIVPVLKTAWEGIKDTIISVWNIIKAVITTAINLVKGIIKTVMQLITGDWSGAWETIKSTVSGLLSGIVNIISNLLKAGVTIVGSMLNNILATFSAIFNGLVGIVTGALKGVAGALGGGMKKAFDTVIGFLGNFKDAGNKIVTSIADGIKGAIGKVTDAIGNIAGKIRDFLPFSPPKIGPLTDIMDVKWGETIGGGIEKGEDAVAKAMDSILDLNLPQRAKFNNPNHVVNDKNMAPQQNQPIILQVDGKTFAQITGDYTSQEGGNRIRRIERGLA